MTPVDLEQHADEAERLAIIAESGDVPIGRARSIARCEAAWRRGAECVCMGHEEAER